MFFNGKIVLHEKLRDSLQFFFSRTSIFEYVDYVSMYDLWYEAHLWMDLGQHIPIYRAKDVCVFLL